MRRLITKPIRRSTSWINGYNHGYDNGFRAGYDNGYRLGYETAYSQKDQVTLSELFEGTSIIIPTYNKINYLRECIDSIHQYTSQPYELIIIDNGSDDGTADYLKSVTGVRYRLLPRNYGFAGAVNQGLLMARGSTILILNNDSVVTTNWLNNLLTCLYSHASYGIVGPVTNYISGEQLIDVSYSTMAEMQQYATAYNQSDPDKWTVTSRLTGFCMLLRRETLYQLGIFDEGFIIGNCEDDDYGLRTRLLGLQLIIAKDTFIHHYGSVSMKELDTKFDEVYGNNLLFYANKWADPHGYTSLEWLKPSEESQLCSNDFYPTCVIVEVAGSNKYWISDHIRRLITGNCVKQATRVSQIDLQGWQLGEEISSDEVEQHIQRLLRPPAVENPLVEGQLVKLREGNVYQYKGGKFHRLMNNQALTMWKLDANHVIQIDQDQLQYAEGAPIICPPVIKADNV